MTIELSVLQICLISAIAVIIFIGGIFLCIRIKKKRSTEIYTIDKETVMVKKPFYEISNNIYRHFGNVWTAHQQNFYSKDNSNVEQTLLDSTDVDKNFANSLLRISSPNGNIFTGASKSAHLSCSNSKCTYLSCYSDDGTEEGVIV